MGRRSRRRAREASDAAPAERGSSRARTRRGLESGYDGELLQWTQRLTGLDPTRVGTALNRVASWGIAPVEERLFRRPTIDSAVAATLLAEGVVELSSHGVVKGDLLAKLENDPAFWPTWAEIRAAAILTETSDDDVEVAVRRGAGDHPRLRFVIPDGLVGDSVEFNAVGLSDAEVAFCRRVAPHLDGLVPPEGLATIHAPLDVPRIDISIAERRRGREGAARAAAQIPRYPRGLSGATIVGQGSEPGYIRRVVNRLLIAAADLPTTDDCWVAFHWTNGAPLRSVVAAIPWAELPIHVAGVIFVGDALVFPDPQIHVFHFALPRGLEPDDDLAIDSELDDEFAMLVLERLQRSSGVRPTLLRGANHGRARRLLRRDGTERILPYNLLMDADPTQLAGAGRRDERRQSGLLI
jgi:hypothetical protein